MNFIKSPEKVVRPKPDQPDQLQRLCLPLLELRMA